MKSTHSHGYLVCIFGIDGGGKSTLARGLVNGFRIGDRTPLYVYARYVPLLSLPIVRLAQQVLDPRTASEYAEKVRIIETHTKRDLLSRRWIASAFVTIILLDYLVQLLFKVWIPYRKGEFIVCDRYIPDTIVTDIAPDLNWTSAGCVRAIRLFGKFAPEPSILLYLRVTPHVALSRKDDIPSQQYLQDRHILYDGVAREMGAYVLDGDRTESEVLHCALDVLNKRRPISD